MIVSKLAAFRLNLQIAVRDLLGDRREIGRAHV